MLQQHAPCACQQIGGICYPQILCSFSSIHAWCYSGNTDNYVVFPCVDFHVFPKRHCMCPMYVCLCMCEWMFYHAELPDLVVSVQPVFFSLAPVWKLLSICLVFFVSLYCSLLMSTSDILAKHDASEIVFSSICDNSSNSMKYLIRQKVDPIVLLVLFCRV